MNLDFFFFLESVMLGAGLAMDAFSVSLANGLANPCMKKPCICKIAGIFSLFQFAMPMIGWLCIHTVAQYFEAFNKLIPWIALALLGWIGGKMLIEGIRGGEEETCDGKLTLTALLIQGVATSIDALSVGFTIADKGLAEAFICALIIAVVTFGLCTLGVNLGRKFGTKLAGKAGILGGVILLIIGIKIFVEGVFFA